MARLARPHEAVLNRQVGGEDHQAEGRSSSAPARRRAAHAVTRPRPRRRLQR
jgi:hypothetical protein